MVGYEETKNFDYEAYKANGFKLADEARGTAGAGATGAGVLTDASTLLAGGGLLAQSIAWTTHTPTTSTIASSLRMMSRGSCARAFPHARKMTGSRSSSRSSSNGRTDEARPAARTMSPSIRRPRGPIGMWVPACPPKGRVFIGLYTLRAEVMRLRFQLRSQPSAALTDPRRSRHGLDDATVGLRRHNCPGWAESLKST